MRGLAAGRPCCRWPQDSRPTFDECGDDDDFTAPIAVQESPVAQTAPTVDADYMAQCDESTWCMYERIIEHRRAVSVDSALSAAQQCSCHAAADATAPAHQLAQLREAAAAAAFLHAPVSPTSGGSAPRLSLDDAHDDEQFAFDLES